MCMVKQPPFSPINIFRKPKKWGSLGPICAVVPRKTISTEKSEVLRISKLWWYDTITIVWSIIMQNQYWLFIVSEPSSTHVCQLHKFITPSTVNLNLSTGVTLDSRILSRGMMGIYVRRCKLLNPPYVLLTAAVAYNNIQYRIPCDNLLVLKPHYFQYTSSHRWHAFT
jgi:hypothetical protein